MDVQEFGARVDDLEKKLDRLRALYEQYFMGIEKIEPGVLRRDVERGVQALRRERCNNTAQRFRFQVLLQRYTTLMAYWQRICRAIEEGTYHPHILRAQRRVGRKSSEPPPADHLPSEIPVVLDLELEPEPEPEAEPEPAAARPRSVPPARPASMPPGPGVARVRSLDDLRRLLEATAADSPPPRPATEPPAVAKPSPAVAKPSPAVAKSSPAVAKPSPAVAKPSPAVAKPSPAVAKPSPADAGPPPAVAKPSPAVAKPAADRPESRPVPDDKVRSIHAAFAAAAKGAAAPSTAAIRQSLEKELERMAKKHPGKQVDFRVDLKDGKPVIKSFVS